MRWSRLPGRRLDAEGAPERFPLQNRAEVEERVRHALEDAGAQIIISSAACGADLLALAGAGDSGSGAG